MSMPVEHDFIDERAVWVGANWARQFTYADDADAAIDLTGWTVTFVVRNAAGTAVLTLTSPSSGVSMPTPSSGVFTVSMTPAQTTATGAGLYTYTLSISDGSSVVALAVGRIAFLGSI